MVFIAAAVSCWHRSARLRAGANERGEAMTMTSRMTRIYMMTMTSRMTRIVTTIGMISAMMMMMTSIDDWKCDND